MPTSGTFCTQVPSGFPGASPSVLNCSLKYSMVRVSPSDPGARPSNASDASRSTSANRVSARIPAATACAIPTGSTVVAVGSDAPPQPTTTSRLPTMTLRTCSSFWPRYAVGNDVQPRQL